MKNPALRTLSAALLTALIGAAGFSAVAQTATPSAANAPTQTAPKAEHGHGMMGQHHADKMNAWRTHQQAALKAKLQLTPAQEGAWTAFTASWQPMAGHHADRQGHKAQMAELSKLPTPERIDRMRALHTQHANEMNAQMDKRSDATKALYAALTAEQKKVFDAETARMMSGGGRGPGGGHEGGHHDGMHHGRG